VHGLSELVPKSNKQLFFLAVSDDSVTVAKYLQLPLSVHAVAHF
jgi:hypothetical protein